MHDLFTLHHANREIRLRKLMFPAALPFMFTGLRISAGLSVIGAIVGDFFFGKGDIGIAELKATTAEKADLAGSGVLSAKNAGHLAQRPANQRRFHLSVCSGPDCAEDVD